MAPRAGEATKTGRRRDRDKRRHRGQWVLVDAEAHLLAIGDQTYEGVNLLGGLDYVARRALAPLLRTALANGRNHRTQTRVDGVTWNAQVIPLRSALAPIGIAALARYDHLDAPDLLPPAIATWEWEVPPPGSERSRGRRGVRWNAAMRELYGLTAAADSWWTWPRWLDEFIALPDRPQLRAMLDQLNTDPDPESASSFCDVTAVPPGGAPVPLRVTGRRVQHGERTLVGGTALRRAAPPVTERGHLTALVTLSRDALCVVDPDADAIYLSSPHFRELGLSLPHSRLLAEMCHSEDFAALRDLVHRAAEYLPADPIPVRLRAAGSWLAVEVTATAVQLTPTTTHVWCRIRPQP